MNRFKRSKGITLVALIITVIILLILAVVSIRAVNGDGIIQYAKNAKSEYEIAQENEQALLDTYLEYLNNEIKPNGGSDAGDNQGGVNSNVFASITSTNYGDVIEYNDPAGVNDWKVFYKDEDYLYIITSDYLENTKLPSGLNMSTGSTYGAYWSNFTSAGASDITSAVANKYKLSWWANNSTSTNNNARATADLLNTTAWTAKFGNSEKGIEATGSPTLEMWVASWNESGYTKLYTALSATGYYVGTTENSTSYSQNVSSDIAGYEDTLYFPHTSIVSECWGYWLTSPSLGSSLVVCVDYVGKISNDVSGIPDYAVRPLVSIPKALVTIAADGTLKVAA